MPHIHIYDFFFFRYMFLILKTNLNWFSGSCCRPIGAKHPEVPTKVWACFSILGEYNLLHRYLFIQKVVITKTNTILIGGIADQCQVGV